MISTNIPELTTAPMTTLQVGFIASMESYAVEGMNALNTTPDGDTLRMRVELAAAMLALALALATEAIEAIPPMATYAWGHDLVLHLVCRRAEEIYAVGP